MAELLEGLAGEEDDYDVLRREEQRLMREGLPMRVGEVSWSRADLHER